jgi:hypothetical protein
MLYLLNPYQIEFIHLQSFNPMRRSFFKFIVCYFLMLVNGCTSSEKKIRPLGNSAEKDDPYQVIIGTFLGDETRKFYGDSCSDSLNVIWKFKLGKGETIVNAASGVEVWSGAGWTGQPLITKEQGVYFIYQASFDHTLKKIKLSDASLIWQYEYEDILKGTGTIWRNKNESNVNPFYIFQGSRKGVHISLKDSAATSFRALHCADGREVWRMPMQKTRSYSNDVDASALFVNDTGYIGLENGYWVSFNPLKIQQSNKGYRSPLVYDRTLLYSKEDAHQHGGNLVTEASPAKLGDHLYIASGCGHVFGYNLKSKVIDWDFYIGSDIDGTPVVTDDNCLLITVEKQYIKGHGGVFKLNPQLPPSQCVQWFYPTEDKKYSSWIGGVVGSCAVNDRYRNSSDPFLAAFTGIDGYLNVVRYKELSDSTVLGPDGESKYPCPKLHFREKVCSSISTPVFAKNKLVMAGYGSINIYKILSDATFQKVASRKGYFESTPVCFNGSIYIACRDGNLYRFGMLETNEVAVRDKDVALNPIKEPKKQVKQPSDTIKKSEKYPKMNIDLKVYKKIQVFNNLKLAQKREIELKKEGKECILYVKRRHKIELYIKRK